MLFDDTYQTIQTPAEGQFKDKGSKFLAFAYPITREPDIKDNLQHLRTTHTKANHFCYACRLGQDRNIFRINDDGEPSGTAGRPILNALLSADLTNILIIVVRYFGGTLLGVPGLIHAYRSAAQESIHSAEVIKKTINDHYELRFAYPATNDIMHIIKMQKLQIIQQHFDNDCTLQLSIRKSQLNNVIRQFDKIESLKIKYIGTI